MAESELTEERIRFVVREHRRLLNKLKRMPGGRTMLPVDRLPDPATGETLIDVVQEHMAPDVRAVFDASQALQPEYLRIIQLAVPVALTGQAPPERLPPGIDPPPTAGEWRAIANTIDEIASSMPMLKRMFASAKKRR